MKTKHGTDVPEEIDGKGTPERIYGEGGGDTIYGGGGGDVIFGGDGDDFLFGENGNDRIRGEDGDDIMAGGAGTDELYGGADNDRLLTIAKGDFGDGGAGNDFYQLMIDKVRTNDKSGDDGYEVDPHGRASIFDAKGADELYFNDGDSQNDVSVDDLTLIRDGDDLIIRTDGFDGKITLSLFYAGTAKQIEKLYDELHEDKSYSLTLKDIRHMTPGDHLDGSDIW